MLYTDDCRIMMWLAGAISRLGNEVDAAVRRAAESKYGDDQLLVEEALEPWLKEQVDTHTYSFKNAVLGWVDGYCEPLYIAEHTKGKLSFEDLDERGRAASILFERVSALHSMCQNSIPNSKLVEKQFFQESSTDFIEMIKALGGLGAAPEGAD